jgi:actin
MAWSKRGILTLCYPVEKGGLVKNFDDYEKLLHEAFYNEMRMAPEEHPVAVLMAPNAPQAQRGKIVQIMFETFNVPAFLYVYEDVAALYPARNGVVVKSGHNGTVISVVRDGRSVPESVVTLSIGGDAVSARLRETLEADFGFERSDLTFELLEEIKVGFS